MGINPDLPFYGFRALLSHFNFLIAANHYELLLTGGRILRTSDTKAGYSDQQKKIEGL